MTIEQKIQEKLAKSHGKSNSQVLLINRSMFEFIAYQMNSGNRKPVRVPKWGLFSCKPERIKKLDEKGLLNTTKEK